MKNMELKESHKILREVYTISDNLEIPFTEVKALSKGDREYLYKTVRSALESGRNPKKVMAANYHNTKAKLFITEMNEDSDYKVREKFNVKNVLNEIETEVVFDTLTFEPDKYDTTVFKLSFDLSKTIYIKYDKEMEEISFKDMVYLNLFDRMYEIQRIDVINAFELGGKYNMLKITKYNEAQSIR